MDAEQVLMIESCVRGGLSMCSNRYAVANNKYIQTRYDSSKKYKLIMYYDKNAMYGTAMLNYLPRCGFQF